MEKRAIFAAMLMAARLMVYQFLFVPAEPPRNAGQPPGGPVAEKPAAPAPASPVPSAPAAVPPKEAPPLPDRSTAVETPLYHAEVGSRGGELKRWDLNYRGQKPMVVPGVVDSRGTEIARGSASPQPVPFAIAPERLQLGRDSAAGALSLTGEDGFGLHVTETLAFSAEQYVLERQIRVENRHNVAQSADLSIQWVAAVEWPKDLPQRFQGQHPTRTVRMTGTSVVREELGKAGTSKHDGRWIALESEWYLIALVPQGSGWQLVEQKRSEARPGHEKPVDVVQVAVQTTLPVLQPGESWQGKVMVYLGPKEYERLKSLGVGLEKSMYFGGFPLPQAYGGLPMEWLAVPILWVINHFRAYTGNYGVAIILLTIITKVLFFPLTIKSMASMKAMQALQPQVNALRSKYKNDPQRLQRETMELYRANRVNPLGGCLPMIVQIPIFYALYVALSVSVEMQNAPFICFGRTPGWVPLIGGQDLWICDLAAHDPTYILPILMGASMFIQQKMTPTMGDPRQAKMMLFMPILFTFMFLNLPSGLVLYWTLSNVLQIAQQKYMEHSAKAEKVPARTPKKA